MSRHTIQIQPGTLNISANLHTNGDGDFDGHGPVMYLNSSLYVASEYKIGLNITVRLPQTGRC
jgi:hypothetical protein